MIEIVGQNKIDISLVSEYSKNILRQIAKNSNYTRVVISSTARAQQERLDGKLKLCITASKINELGASKVSRHCADFNIVNVVDIPHSSLGVNKTDFNLKHKNFNVRVKSHKFLMKTAVITL